VTAGPEFAIAIQAMRESIVAIAGQHTAKLETCAIPNNIVPREREDVCAAEQECVTIQLVNASVTHMHEQKIVLCQSV